jgi:hypothetical protein
MHRQREWDEVIVVDAPTSGVDAGELHLVVLGDDRILVDGGTAEAASVLLARLHTRPPYRAWIVARSDGRVGVAARAIDVVELVDDPGGDELELVWDGTERTLRIDGEPSPIDVPELEQLGRRHATFAVTAQRLDGTAWEVLVAPL